jgi:hypothetical protein
MQIPIGSAFLTGSAAMGINNVYADNVRVEN